MRSQCFEHYLYTYTDYKQKKLWNKLELINEQFKSINKKNTLINKKHAHTHVRYLNLQSFHYVVNILIFPMWEHVKTGHKVWFKEENWLTTPKFKIYCNVICVS